MITSVDLPERSTFLGNKAYRALKKMRILSQLPRRFHDMLTTDAKPDPPRTGIEGYTHNLPPTSDEDSRKTQSKSAPTTPEKEHNDDVTMQQQKSVPNDARPTTPTDFCTKSEDLGDTKSTSESKEYKRPRTKTKSKHNKYSQGTNVINYNIVNSNGVKIGSRTSYICNVNQYSASNNASTAQPEATSWSKPKYRSMPENVEELSTCKEELAFDDMFVIKTHVGHGWRDIARRLSYSDGQIEQFEENYRHKGIDEVIYQLLLDWKQANTQDAQLGVLVSILWSCQEYDCVERLAAARKNSF
ncbi:Receptor-interacting serine/threonine-protein kinase 1 [Camponotus floridanus]|uniref:Receptor-interacting serine/threonine-protein kinase 1 n=1 Tax=Camponotus floridanus TaxID=104421 RepID=E2AZC7_CAMFO|nr:uncharacterized protein LOC105257646 [Camponotus floridanus]EFN61166.1 Receptor-interacting serine/threonine-protein kinase 1 [Camponotus floridanus]